MAPTRDFNQAVLERIQSDNEFATGLFAEAMSALLEGETDVARLLLRDLINGTIGFEPLAEQVGIPSKSLHRMLSARGNPSMNNLSGIIDALRRRLKVNLKIEAADVGTSEEKNEPKDGDMDCGKPYAAMLAPDLWHLYEQASGHWSGALIESAETSVSADTLEGIKAFTLIATFEKCLATVLNCPSDRTLKNWKLQDDRARRDRAVFVSSSEFDHLVRATKSGIRALSKSLKVDLTLQDFPGLFGSVQRDIDLELDRQIKELTTRLEHLTTRVLSINDDEERAAVDERRFEPCILSREGLQQCTRQVQALIRALLAERAKHQLRG